METRTYTPNIVSKNDQSVADLPDSVKYCERKKGTIVNRLSCLICLSTISINIAPNVKKHGLKNIARQGKLPIFRNHQLLMFLYYRKRNNGILYIECLII